MNDCCEATLPQVKNNDKTTHFKDISLADRTPPGGSVDGRIWDRIAHLEQVDSHLRLTPQNPFKLPETCHGFLNVTAQVLFYNISNCCKR